MGFFSFLKNRNSKLGEEEIYDEKIEYDEIDQTAYEEQYVNDATKYEEEEKFDYGIIMKNSIKRKIEKEILKVVESYNDSEIVNIVIEEAVESIGKDNVELIKEYLIDKIELPEYIKNIYTNNINIVVENSILMIIYNFNEDGVDELLKIAATSEEYKLKAINLLCKLASKSVSTDKIVDSIIFIMKSLTEDEVQKVLLFLSQIKNNLKISRLLELYYKKYIVENNFELAYDTIINIVNLKGKCSEEQLIFLKALALCEVAISTNLIVADQEGELDFKDIKDDLRVKAAVSYYSLNREDDEVNYRLIYLKENSLQTEIRDFLRGILI